MLNTDDMQPLPQGEILLQKSGVNARNAVRYGKVPNQSELCGKGFLWFARTFAVEVHDLSSRGAKIMTRRKLALDADYVLKIAFSNDKVFEIPGKIIRKDADDEYCYGFKFNAPNDALGEYLFRSQTVQILNTPR